MSKKRAFLRTSIHLGVLKCFNVHAPQNIVTFESASNMTILRTIIKNKAKQKLTILKLRCPHYFNVHFFDESRKGTNTLSSFLAGTGFLWKSVH